MLYSDILNGINDRMNNSYFSSTKSNEIFRSVNQALRDINAGKLSDDPLSQPKRRVAYDFQKESTDLTYASGTERYAVVATVGIALNTLKWIDNILIDDDENKIFTKRTADYYRRKRGVNTSTEKMFAEEYQNGTKYLLIYHSESDTLNVIWYSNYLVTYGGIRQLYFSDGTTLNNQELLIPDDFADCVIDITCGYLTLMDRNEQSLTSNLFLNRGRETLRNMINSIGCYEKKPVSVINLPSEWGIY